MHSDQIKSQTASILANLEKKISKYLSPSYETIDVFEKSKAITKNHEEVIQNNKDFLKKHQSQQFIKNEQQNSNEFDQLLHRRRKCQAKLHQMLFDHQVEESLKIDFSPSKNQESKSPIKQTGNRLFSVSSLRQVKSQVLLPTTSVPNFQRIQKELQSMQKQLQKLSKKVDKNSTASKKSNSQKGLTQQSKVSLLSKNKRSEVKYSNKKNQTVHSKKHLSPKIRSNSSKKGSSLDLQSKPLNNKKLRPQKQNSEEKNNQNNLYKNPTDQTSLFAKLTNQQTNTKEKSDLQSSKLKKVGIKKFNEASKKMLDMTKCRNMQQDSKQIDSQFSKNRIKVNLLQCESQQVL